MSQFREGVELPIRREGASPSWTSQLGMMDVNAAIRERLCITVWQVEQIARILPDTALMGT